MIDMSNLSRFGATEQVRTVGPESRRVLLNYNRISDYVWLTGGIILTPPDRKKYFLKGT